MLHIDHISLGAQNVYEGAHRLCEETGFGQYEGGWFPHAGIANRIVPLGNDQYIEVEGVVHPHVLDSNPIARWFYDECVAGDVFLGWCLRVDTRRELEEISRRLDTEIVDFGLRVRKDGKITAPARVPESVWCWQRGIPNVFHFEDMDEHAARQPCDPPGRVTPTGIAWMEVGGTAQDLRDYLGEEVDALPLRFNGDRPGLYAMGVNTPDGEVEIRRTAVSRFRE